ncbi:MAG: MogA/MoaB family molybdenum cofactor biosynthesis protein [Desulfosalsimonadaceae bacterium]
MSHKEHKKQAPRHLRVAIITVSTSRSPGEDDSGNWMNRQARREGHSVVCHKVIPDEQNAISRTATKIIEELTPELLLINGGTGISPGDVTLEAVRPLLDKEMTAFATLFAQLSFEAIDSAAMLSRACAGTIRQTAVFCLPGSTNACKLACKALIFPEAAHIAGHLQG